MQLIDLDTQDGVIETLFFPGGEPHCKLLGVTEQEVLLRANIRSWEDFGSLVVILNALYEADHTVALAMPYFPGARQDRVTHEGAPLTVEMYAEILGRYVRTLYTFDLHSEAARIIIKNEFSRVHEFQLADLPLAVLPQDIECIIVPDHGAIDRADLLHTRHYPEADIIVCTKDRDEATGKIMGMQLPKLPPYVESFMIVDDVCDGGATFNSIATLFAENAPPKAFLDLVVSHGIFSRGVDHLHERITHITTTDSWFYDYFHEIERVSVVPVDFMYRSLVYPAVDAMSD
jgi:ribose-phosphate pyrophosphokinase